MLNMWVKFLEKINFISLLISIFTLLVIVTINVINIVMRILFADSLPWVLELSMLLHVYSVFFGMCVVYYRKKTIIMTMVLDKCTKGFRLFLELFGELSILFFLGVLLFNAIHFESFVRNHITPGIGISRSLIVLPVILASIILLLTNINNIFNQVVLIINNKKGGV